MTKINQLFKSKVDNNIFLSIINLYGLTDLTDHHEFSCDDLERWKTAEKMSELVPELEKYYLPCKANIYLRNLTPHKCVTILRQILKSFGIKLISKQKYISKKKTTLYSILKSSIRSDNRDGHSVLIENKNLLLQWNL